MVKLELLLLIILFVFSGCLGQEKAKSLVSDNPAAFDRTTGSGSDEASSLGFVITAVTPSAGTFSGNYNITISGSQFDAFTTFTIDGVSCLSTTIVSNSSAICRVPAGTTGLKDVTATKPGKTNNLVGGFQYTGAATFTSIAPTIAPATTPTLVTLTGTNFVSGATVNVSHPTLVLSACSSVNVVNSTTITCYTPALTAGQSHAIEASGILASVVITNPDGTQISLNNSIDLTPAPQYTSLSYGVGGVTAPPVDGVLHSGASAYTLSINGNYFDAGVTVTVNGSAAGSCSYASSTLISCSALPAIAGGVEGTYNLVITNSDAQADTESILFVKKPSITSTTPSNMNYSAGDIVTLNGTGLGLSPTITIYNNANTVSLGACSLATSVPVSCTTPVLGSAQATTVRLTNDYGYRTTYNPLNFITATTLSYSQQNIGRVVQGSSYNHTLQVLNPSGTVTATGVSVDTSALAAPFSYVSTTCGATIAPMGSCNIVIQYSPTALKIESSGNIVVNYTNGISATTLTGKVYGIGISLDVLMTSLNFGTIPYGNNHLGNPAKYNKPVVLINRGRSTVTLNSGAFTDATHFTHTGGTYPGSGFGAYLCGGTLAAGAKCLVSLDFIPTSTGAKSTTYTLTYNTSYSKSVSVSGTAGAATNTTCNPANTTWNAQGSGTSGSPYLICTEAQFTNLITASQANTGNSRTSYFLQTADITFTANITNPIWGTLGFNYNGGGYRLIDPTIVDGGSNYRGLFYGQYGQNATVSAAQVYNANVTAGSTSSALATYWVNITDSFVYGNVSASSYSGGIHSWTDTSSVMSINNTYFIGTVTCSANYCGGLSGAYIGISNSFSHGTITGQSYTSGILAAQAYAYTVSNVASSMDVTGVSYTGGIVGTTWNSVDRANFYGTVSGSNYVGGIVGGNIGLASYSITKCSFMGTLTSTGTNAGGISSGIADTGGSTLNVSESVSSGTINGVNSVGGITGGVGHWVNSTNVINDSFSLSYLNLSGNYAGGIVGNNTATGSVNRSYVAYPNSQSMYSSTGSNKFVVGYSVPSASGAYYLVGIYTDQTTPAGIDDLTDAQLQTQSVLETFGSYDFTVGTGKWKYSTLLPTEGYPYPMLQWMPNDWMP